MACGACGNRRKHTATPDIDRIFSNYKYLTDRQINARISAYKRRYCTECTKQTTCDFTNFVACKNIK